MPRCSFGIWSAVGKRKKYSRVLLPCKTVRETCLLLLHGEPQGWWEESVMKLEMGDVWEKYWKWGKEASRWFRKELFASKLYMPYPTCT